jgi:anti-anti-sigma factor
MTINEAGQDTGVGAGVEVVAPAGELDVENLEPLRAELLRAAEAARAVVLDAERITFGDSSFLRVLIEVNQVTDLRIAAPRPVLDRLIKMVGMDRVLKVYPTLEEATAVPAG